MYETRFFQSTRGKIVSALRRRRTASAVELAAEFGLTPNAVRQQLTLLEHDGYVAERSVKRGPTKPTLEYSLTAGADALFPQRYDRMLGAVLREVKTSFGPDGVDTVMKSLGRREAEKYRAKLTASDPKGRAIELAALLRANGVEADVVETAEGSVELREHNCPYANTVGEHPELCSIIRTVLTETVSGDTVQLESLATGGDACRFEIASAREAVRT